MRWSLYGMLTKPAMVEGLHKGIDTGIMGDGCGGRQRNNCKGARARWHGESQWHGESRCRREESTVSEPQNILH